MVRFAWFVTLDIHKNMYGASETAQEKKERNKESNMFRGYCGKVSFYTQNGVISKSFRFFWKKGFTGGWSTLSPWQYLCCALTQSIGKNTLVNLSIYNSLSLSTLFLKQATVNSEHWQMCQICNTKQCNCYIYPRTFICYVFICMFVYLTLGI